MNSYFKQIIKEEIEKETETPKYFIVKCKRKNYDTIQICEYVRDFSFSNEIWANIIEFDNYGISLASSQIAQKKFPVKREGIIPISTNYYDLINKNLINLEAKEELIRTVNSTEGYFRNAQIGDIFWVFDDSIHAINFYIVGNDMFKKLSFIFSSKGNILWVEKGGEFTNNLEFNKVNYIDRIEGLKLFKMYDLMENILKNISDNYGKNE